MRKAVRSILLGTVVCGAVGSPLLGWAQEPQSSAPAATAPVTAQDQQTALKNEEKANRERAKSAKEQRKALKAQQKAAKAEKKAGQTPTAAPPQ